VRLLLQETLPEMPNEPLDHVMRLECRPEVHIYRPINSCRTRDAINEIYGSLVYVWITVQRDWMRIPRACNKQECTPINTPMKI
jgi:hypothetical protein